MLDLTPLKHHLRIDHDEEDALLTAYLSAAKSTFMITDAIKQGALLLIGHWYAHREAVSDRLLHTTPYAVEALWLPYKYRRV